MQEAKTEENINGLKPRMKALDSIEDLEISPGLMLLAKADGEFTKLQYKRNGQSYTINRYGHFRTDFPALNELVEALDKNTSLQEAEILCELFAVDENDCPLILPQFIHCVKSHDEELLKKVHIGVWDLASVNGVRVTQDFSWKLQELETWLRKTGYEAFESRKLRLDRAYVLPHKQPKNFAEVKEFWVLWVDKIGYEGVVARSNGQSFKIKPVLDVDAVIIALNKVDSTGKPTKRWVEQKVSTVRVALMNKNGIFVELGDCTVADPKIQTALWELLDFKVSEDHQRVYVKPIVVCEIKYTSVFEGSLCTYWSFDSEYQRQGSRKFYKMRHPRFLRFRPDKKVCPEDLRLDQMRNDDNGNEAEQTVLWSKS